MMYGKMPLLVWLVALIAGVAFAQESQPQYVRVPWHPEPIEIIVPKADPPESAQAKAKNGNGAPALVVGSLRDSGMNHDATPETDTVAAAASPGPAEKSAGTLGVIGEVEPVFVEDIPEPFAARIDTGAAQCSFDIEEMKLFERDSKPWVAFGIRHRDTGELHMFERPVKRTLKIRQSQGTQKRVLVEMKVRMGDLTLRRDFTLSEREDLAYQVLIGRNLLSGLAVVDVSRINTLAAPTLALE